MRTIRKYFLSTVSLHLTAAVYRKGVLIEQTQSAVEVDAKSIVINQLMTAVFTITGLHLIDVDSLALTQ